MLTSEMLNFTPPAIEKAEILKALSVQFALTGDLSPLEGERDQNHRLETTAHERYVVKISGPGESADVVDFQIGVLLHAKKAIPDIAVPHVVQTVSGKFVGEIIDAKGQRLMLRVLSYVDGEPVAAGAAATLEMAYNAGLYTGQLAYALRDFTHPASSKFMAWNVANGLVADPELWAVAGSDVQALQRYLRPHLKDKFLPALSRTRYQVIHNDSHADNLLRAHSDATEPCGLIDFGDVTTGPLVNDAAIVALGMIERSGDPVAIAAQAIAGYHHSHPLRPDELDLMYDGILARSILQVLLFDFKIAHNASTSGFARQMRPMFMETTQMLLDFGNDPFQNAILNICSAEVSFET